MAHEIKTSIGNRNVLVRNGAGNSTTVWLELQQADGRTDCLALTSNEAMVLARALSGHGLEASRRAALVNLLPA